MPNWPAQSAVEQFYGRNIRIRKGVAGPDPDWEKANLVLVPIPWKAVASWDRAISMKNIRIHRKCAESLALVLDEIRKRFENSQKAIDVAGMNLIGGGYNWRQMRGKSILSMHAYGCAVDFDPDRNGLGDPTPAMDLRVVDVFETAEWTWGGRWSPRNRDGMHFQAANV